MANIGNSPLRNQKIRKKNLVEIGSISFTPRQIDVLACLVHMRNYSKIAELLEIESTRTVQTHIRDIRAKLGGIAVEHVIDFVEKSGKRKYLVEYYFNIVVESYFKTKLQKLRKLIISNDKIHYLQKGNTDASKHISLSLQKITEHLNIVGIIQEKPRDSLNSEYVLYLIINNSSLHPDQKLQHEKDELQYVYLLLDKSAKTTFPTEIKNYIDFSDESTYYSALFSLLKFISGNKSAVEVVESEFNEEYGNLQDSWNGTIATNTLKTANNSTKYIHKTKIGVLFIIVIILLITIVKCNTQHGVNSIDEVNRELANFAKSFSFKNVTTSINSRTYQFTKDIEKLKTWIFSPKVASYFMKNNVSHTELINYLYSLNVLAIYYHNNEHNGVESRNVLFFAKKLIEQHIQNQCNMQINFHILTKEEVYTELSLIKDLPEIYAQIMYSIGRSYIYQGSLEESMPYFEISNYLGTTTGLFEGFLSVRSGSEVIRKSQIYDNIRNNNYQAAREKILKALLSLKNLRDDVKIYKINYKFASDRDFHTIIPKEDIYNTIWCDEEIAKYYLNLIMISKDSQEKKKYLQEIADLFIRTKKTQGLLTQLKKVSNRKQASIYNTLGHILLYLHNNHVNFEQFKIYIIRELQLKKITDVEVIEEIFRLAQFTSRNTDYTKADSYDGLAKLYESMIATEQIQDQQKIDELQKQIKILNDNRENINLSLDRQNKSLLLQTIIY